MVGVSGTRPIGLVTGAESINDTARRFGITATDLGILWDNGQGKVLAAFGDTYGAGWGGHGAGPSAADWRYNVLASSTSRDLDAGLALDAVVTRRDGRAAQILGADREEPVEATVIPNSGIAVRGYNYLHYMSVRRWGAPGGWSTNYGGIAVSADGGQTWTKPSGARWFNTEDGAHPFQICAFAGHRDHVHLVGTTNGRFGPAYLARARHYDVADARAYEYWTEDGWRRGDPFAAVPVLPGPVGELSIMYSEYLGRWLAMHLDEYRAAIVLHDAAELTGPWSPGEVVVSGADYPALYGGFLHPWANTGPSVYFTLSQWGPYNVTLMRTDLNPTLV
jgi:hypothetical protein